MGIRMGDAVVYNKSNRETNVDIKQAALFFEKLLIIQHFRVCVESTFLLFNRRQRTSTTTSLSCSFSFMLVKHRRPRQLLSYSRSCHTQNNAECYVAQQSQWNWLRIWSVVLELLVWSLWICTKKKFKYDFKKMYLINDHNSRASSPFQSTIWEPRPTFYSIFETTFRILKMQLLLQRVLV